MTLSIDKKIHNIPIKRDYTYVDNNKLLENIKSESWNIIYNHNDPNYCYETFIDKIHTNILKSTKTIKYKSKNKKRKEWISRQILELMSQRDMLHQQCLKFPYDINLKNEYKKLRNKINNQIKYAKNNYLKGVIYNGKMDSKRIWEGVKRVTNTLKREQEITKICLQDKTFYNPDEIANTFNSYYKNVGYQLAKNIKNGASCTIYENKSNIFINPTSSAEVLKYIQELKKRESRWQRWYKS